MYIKILLEYIFGYLYIQIEGFFVEKVMNNCISKKIFFWNIKRDKTTIIYVNIGIKDFKELLKISKKNGCKIKIINKKGLPFLFNRYRKRKTFFIFTILIFISLVVLSNFIWNIQIEGLDKINQDDIINELSNDGLKIGILKKSINTKSIINKIRLERSDISWIGIELNGTNALVKIVEADEKPDIVDDKDYCNIVSTKDAQIVKISAQNGTPVVKEGDIVTKDQILIAGWMNGKYTSTRYVHSEGEIEAKVWYTEKEKIELTQTIKEETGKQENKYEIKINNFSINLYKTLSKFKIYDTIYTSNKLKIFSNFYLPIELTKITNYEEQEYQISYGNDEAKEIGVSELSEKIESEIENKDNILQKYVNSYATDTYVEVEVTYEVLENIGTKEKIVF